MKKLISRVKEHLETDGFIGTLYWLYNCIVFKLRKKVVVKSGDFEKIEIEKDEEKYLTFKKRTNVYIVAGVPYYDIGGGQRCSQLTKTFNKMGYNVTYLYGFESSDAAANLTMPMQAHMMISDKTISIIEERVTENDLFIFEAPSDRFAKVLELALEKKCKVVYENIDNWETSLGSTVYHEETLKKLIKESTVLVGTAKPLAQQLEGYLKKYEASKKPVLYLANAVDDELFCPLKNYEKPWDLITDKVTLLYYGSLWGEWFDWDLLIDLAIKNPRYSINLIGDFSGIYNICHNCPHNIHFLGKKNQVDLPAYLKYVDYTLVPFKTGEIGDYVSPLKVFEYIAMRTRVLCTSLPDVQGYPNVYCGDTVEEWDAIIKSDPKLDERAADEFTIDNSWFNRVSQIIDYCYPEASKSIFRDKLSVVILNYNNKNVIFKCVDTLMKFKELYNYEIVVVDNGSKDGSYELLKEKYTNNEIVLVQNVKNGCSSGRNLGVASSHGEYIMFLDSDQWVTNKYWLMPYEDIMQSNSNVGLIGWAAGFFNRRKYAYHVVDSFPYRYMPSNALCRYDIGYLGSGGMIVSRKDFETVGGFDLYYDPTCYEDTDFSLKVRDLGKEIYYCPYLGIFHLPHQTTKSGSKEHLELTRKKQEYFIKKWTEKNPKLLSLYIK